MSLGCGAEWQLPLLRLDVGKIFSGLVGSSEENMRRAIQTAEAIAPSILWIDEIEKGFSNTNRTNDSGTSSRVFATFLTWMQEKTKPVFVIATSNNINALPPELLRKGRFDEIFFVDLPTLRERKAIFGVHLQRLPNNPRVLGTFRVTDVGLDSLAQLTEGFIGAEIEQVVTAALFEAFADDRSITFSDFRKAIDNTVPLARTQAEQIRAIREWADKRAVAATAPEDVKATNSTTTQLAPDDVASRRGGRLIDI